MKKSDDASPVVVFDEYEFYPMDHPDLPRGQRCLALTQGGVTVQEIFTSANIDFYEGWFPLPKRPKVRTRAADRRDPAGSRENIVPAGGAGGVQPEDGASDPA